MRGLVLHLKFLLTLIGSRCSKYQLRQIQAAVNYLRLGRWMVDRNFHFEQRLRDRTAVFDRVASRMRDKRVLYLEFGVYQGATMRYWSRQLRNPEAKLHGFDSFEGLPEDWGPHAKGHFDTGGAVPKIDDVRVKFFEGWFDQVLPQYSVPEHDALVIVMDADLYSSTIYVLRHLRPYVRPGTCIYFDEMNEIDHEPKAFEEFMEESRLRFRLVSANRSLSGVFFECYEAPK